MAAPFLNAFTLPSIERSPSGNSTSTLPCRRPNAPACIAGTRLESGSTGITRANRASRAVNGVSKYSLAPTKNSCRKTRKGSAPATRNESK